jgi:prostaglandin reductase 1
LIHFKAFFKNIIRGFPAEIGKRMIGEQLSEVIKTRNGQFPLGTLVLSKAGWTNHYISTGEDLSPISFDIGSTPISHTLGALGMPGATAFCGLKQCSPKSGEIFLITAAAGAVGSIVGQLAKLKGLKVIGLVGSDEKLDWCKNELGFDHVFNYKKCNWSDELAKVAPDGVDIYWDHVGDEYYTTVINKHMRKDGRVLVVGSIENYNDVDKRSVPATNISILMKGITVKGFLVYFFGQNEWANAFTQMNKLIQEGKLKTKETTYVGFEKMFEAFVGLFKGDNTGKAIIKVVNTQTNYP